MTDNKIFNWVIYKITNPVGAIYIGRTSSLLRRIRAYKYYECVNQQLLYRSLVKYGFENHELLIIDSFQSTMDYAHGKEMFWVRSFMSNKCKWRDGCGMNLTDGGEGTIGYKASEDHRKRLSEIHKKIPISPEHREKMNEGIRRYLQSIPKKVKPIKIYKDKEETRLKMSLAKKGKPAWNKGIPTKPDIASKLRAANIGRPSKFKGISRWSEEEKKKMGMKNIGNTYNKGRKHSPEISKAKSLAMMGKPNIKNRKPIIQYSLDYKYIKEFGSVKEAAIDLKMSQGTISDILIGGIKNPSTFRFKYKVA